MLALSVSLVACDDDPTGSREVFPDFDLADVPDTLGTQQAIRVIFGD